MSSYPKWLYHATKEAELVADEAAHRALGAGWVESPADLTATVKMPAALKAELLAESKSEEKPAKKVK